MSVSHPPGLLRALLAAVMFGPVAPIVGMFLVQRRMTLLGDGMGHIATTGIGLALLLGTAPIPTAMVVAAAGAILVEVIRERSRTAGDVALALIFYGGIAGGVMLVSLSGATSVLNSYLFGSNAPFIEALYESYLKDPGAVEPRWR